MQLKYKEDSGTFNVTEDKLDNIKAEYMFLTETPGGKEGLDGMNDTTSDVGPNDVTKLAQ